MLKVNLPINELSPEQKTMFALRYPRVERYTIVNFDTPSEGDDLVYTTCSSDTGQLYEDIFYHDEVPARTVMMYFEKVNGGMFNIYTIFKNDTLAIDGPCSEEFLYFLNKTINPMYDEAFRVMLNDSNAREIVR